MKQEIKLLCWGCQISELLEPPPWLWESLVAYFPTTNSVAREVWVASNSPTWSLSFENRRKGDKGFIFLNKSFPSRKGLSIIQISISHTGNEWYSPWQTGQCSISKTLHAKQKLSVASWLEFTILALQFIIQILYTSVSFSINIYTYYIKYRFLFSWGDKC